MKRIGVAILACAVAGTRGGGGLAQEEGGGAPQVRRENARPPQVEGRGGYEGWRGPQGGPGFMEQSPQEALIMRALNDTKIAQELGISQEQVKAIKDGLQQFEQGEKDLLAQLQKAATDQAKSLTDRTLDENALISAVENAGKIRTDLAKVWMKKLLVIRNVLTPQQIEKAKGMIRERMDRFRERREEFRRGGPGGGRRGGQQGQQRPPATAPAPAAP
jgi:hypothetical protein